MVVVEVESHHQHLHRAEEEANHLHRRLQPHPVVQDYKTTCSWCRSLAQCHRIRITVLPCYIVSQLILYPSPSPPLPHFTASSRNIVPCLSISHSCMILDTTQHNERLWCWTRSSELHPSVGITKGGLQTHSSAACWSRPGKKIIEEEKVGEKATEIKNKVPYKWQQPASLFFPYSSSSSNCRGYTAMPLGISKMRMSSGSGVEGRKWRRSSIHWRVKPEDRRAGTVSRQTHCRNTKISISIRRRDEEEDEGGDWWCCWQLLLLVCLLGCVGVQVKLEFMLCSWSIFDDGRSWIFIQSCFCVKYVSSKSSSIGLLAGAFLCPATYPQINKTEC